MGIGIFLREERAVSYFQSVIQAMVGSLPGEELILCSGYFSPQILYSPYSGLSTLAVNIRDNGSNITLIGAHFGSASASKTKQLKEYAEFCKHVSDIGRLKHAFVAKEENWHAKVAIKMFEGKPIAVFIGSSNLTHPAYTSDSWLKHWNRECDVLIFLDSKDQKGELGNLLKQAQNTLGVLAVIPDPEIEQPNLSQRMQKIHDDVMNSEMDAFDWEKEL